jgi:hypothetical protein
MDMKYGRALMALVVLLATVGPVAADTKWSQISWYTAVSVAHSIVYGIYNNTVACSQTALYYVEPAPINGIATKLNASTDQTGLYPCQNTTQGAFKVQNDGSVGLNVSATFNQITTGVRPKIGGADAAWEAACTGTCTTGDCALSANCIALTTSFQQVAYNIPQNSSKEYWLWADFKGVAGTAAPTKGNLTTNATQAGA